jgi:putative spermidine/putrescine transport system ATP-binding protein
LTPSADAPIAAEVESAEYRGRDFFGFARTLDGAELYFRSEARVRPGEAIRLGAPADRVLAYANGAA